MLKRKRNQDGVFKGTWELPEVRFPGYRAVLYSQLGTPNRAKMKEKSYDESMFFLTRLGTKKMSEIGAKILPKSMPKVIKIDTQRKMEKKTRKV